MARGWESKSVESQQESAAEKPSSQKTPSQKKLTTEETARKAERGTLALARTRALADLQHACAPAHRAMLEAAIGELDRKLAELDT